METETELEDLPRKESVAIYCGEWLVDPPVTLVIHFARDTGLNINGFDPNRWMEKERTGHSFEPFRESVY